MLVGCTKAPSQLACEVWDKKLLETGELVNYWAELSNDRTLTREEKSKAWDDQNSYLALLREMDSVGCEY